MGDKNYLPLHPQLAPLELRVFVLRSPILITKHCARFYLRAVDNKLQLTEFSRIRSPA